MESRQHNVSESEDDRTISPRVTRSMTFLDGTENSLPIDMVIEIFSRMPSKSIARSRCVSRLWESILGGQDFTESFLAKSCARPQILFLFQDYFQKKEKSEILFFSSPQPQNPDGKSSIVAAKYHLAQFASCYEFFDRTDGFFCYGAERTINQRRHHMFVSVICNPTTGQSLTLPKLNTWRSTGDSYLGYDPITKEFKVLSMTYRPGDNDRISEEHQVLTVATKNMSWRMVECSIPHYASRIWICISGVLYYIASRKKSSVKSMVVCFDLRSEKFSVVEFMETFHRALLPDFATPINYNGKLGLLMSSENNPYVRRRSTSFELWVLEDAGKHRWSRSIYVLPPQWKDSVPKTMRIAGMVGTSDIVLSPRLQSYPSYVIYYNVQRKTITKVGIKGTEALEGKRSHTFINYVENVKFI